MNYINFEFRLILFLSLLLGISMPFLNFSKNEVAVFFVFYLLEIGHIYASFLKSFNKGSRNKSKYLFISSILLNYLAALIFPSSFFVFLFYFTLIHYVQKTLESSAYYANKNQILKFSLFLYIIFLTLAFHFRDLKFGTDLNYELRPINIHYLFSADIASQFFAVFNTIGMITILAGIVYSFRKVKFKDNLVYIFWAIIWGISLIWLNDIFISMALLIIPHSIFSYSETLRSISKDNKFIRSKKSALMWILGTVLIACLIELNIEDNSYLFQGHLKLLVQAISFFPLTYHYLFELCEYLEITFEQR